MFRVAATLQAPPRRALLALGRLLICLLALGASRAAVAQTAPAASIMLSIEPRTFVAGTQSTALVTITNVGAGTSSFPADFIVGCTHGFGAITPVSAVKPNPGYPILVDSLSNADGGVVSDVANMLAESVYNPSGATSLIFFVDGNEGDSMAQGSSVSIVIQFTAGQATDPNTGVVSTFSGSASCELVSSNTQTFPVSPPGWVTIGISAPGNPFGPVGPTGPAGSNGTNGSNGATGAQGPQGAAGARGVTGANGTNGSNGATGPQGPQGAAGAQGPQGAAGAQGPQGAAGAQGPQGAAGAQGPQGAAGARGATGANGTNGSNGATGATGSNGSNGTNGTNGANGSNGATGAQGSNGATGAIGATGATGTNGAAGAAGVTGANGAAGLSPTVTATAVSNGSCGIAGGTQYTFMLNGSVVSTTVVCNGAAGAQGATGVTGADGAAGPQGSQGPFGPAGSAGATGSSGPTGPTGPAGSAGTNGTPGATGAEGATGSEGAANGGCGTAPGQPSEGAIFLALAGLVIHLRRRAPAA